MTRVPPEGRLGERGEATIIRRREFVKEMSPRNYDMSKRAAAVAQTGGGSSTRRARCTPSRASPRRAGTTSRRARASAWGPSTATSPRSTSSSPPAARSRWRSSRCPTRRPRPPSSTAPTRPAERIERLVREAFAIYERGAPELRVIRNEPGAHPSVAEAGERLEASLAALVDAAGDRGRRSPGRPRDDRPRHLAGAPRPGPRARGGRRRRQPDARYSTLIVALHPRVDRALVQVGPRRRERHVDAARRRRLRVGVHDAGVEEPVPVVGARVRRQHRVAGQEHQRVELQARRPARLRLHHHQVRRRLRPERHRVDLRLRGDREVHGLAGLDRAGGREEPEPRHVAVVVAGDHVVALGLELGELLGRA